MTRKATILAAAIAIVALSATAGVSRRRAVIALPKSDLTITFTRTFIDAGTIAHKTSGDWRFTRTFEDVGVRIDSGSAATRRAILRASLPATDAQYIVRVDGITLGPLSVVIDSRAAIGVTTPHRIEIEVPVSAPEGALMTSISWEAETP